ncbi:HEAT repeat domain-containing protein [Gemmatimonas sp.]|jgi:HEAT repeat protein|uniref:HEAT repeat domain-containing protein n=1 Tax=Gemmatimonas sp. TaxID=1962908 RepID=UPI00261C81F0|nr:HEAT repeat domain-containing protein [Gemmatimonas sp.]
MIVRPLMSRLTAIGGACAVLCGMLPTAIAAQQPPRPRPAPAPAPADRPAPAAPLAPPAPRAGLDVLARLDALDPYIAETVGHALASVDARGIAELARLSSTDMVAMAAEGARLGMESAAMAMRMVPFAAEGGVWTATTERARGYRTMAPEPWDAQDLADSLYREARKALSGDSYQRAAELFKQIRQKYPKSSYAPDAPYWEAFALQRLGGQQNLHLAQDALGLQQRDYPRAATRGDAAALSARIEGMLGRRGNVAAAQSVLGRAERAANDGCPRAEDDERVDALNAVTQMDAERAMPILKKVLARREPCTQQLRRTAVWLIARQKSPEAASLLMNAAKSDPDREVREQAVFWLANVPSEEAVNMLVDLARNGEELDMRKRAVYALSRAGVGTGGRSGSDRALATLRDITADVKAPEELRVEALHWYLGRKPPEVAEPLAYLADVYAKSNGQMLKETVLRYIASLRSDESRAYLVALAVHGHEPMEVRRTAVAYLGTGGGYSSWTPRVVGQTARRAGGTVLTATPGSAQADAVSRPAGSVIVSSLVQVYDTSREMEIRRQVLALLASVRDNAGTDKLISVARTEKNPELRRAAITYLTRSKDPRALELLQEIINK